ncbi:hypothetical protein [Massilibacteroides vaginae]|uniref:hypothetical protein n=1 Tax=Massilibacteroides vaginae TaxID=1673718 RepID=UPI000A1CCCE8|nr:hypothetical protein [Massilibacteroides vaginae]
MVKKTSTSIGLDYFKDYISYEETLKALCIKKPTLQEHIREGKKFIEPGDTIILPNRKRVFLRSAVQREIANVLHENGVREL